MKTIELIGQVDEQHRLSAQVPPDVPPGPVKLALVVESNSAAANEEDEAGAQWASASSSSLAAALFDSTTSANLTGPGGTSGGTCAERRCCSSTWPISSIVFISGIVQRFGDHANRSVFAGFLYNRRPRGLHGLFPTPFAPRHGLAADPVSAGE